MGDQAKRTTPPALVNDEIGGVGSRSSGRVGSMYLLSFDQEAATLRPEDSRRPEIAESEAHSFEHRCEVGVGDISPTRLSLGSPSDAPRPRASNQTVRL